MIVPVDAARFHIRSIYNVNLFGHEHFFAVRKTYYFCSFCHGKSSVIINNLLLQMTQKKWKKED